MEQRCKIIKFKKTKAYIQSSYDELISSNHIPDIYKTFDLSDIKKLYVPLFLFNGEITGDENRSYKNVNHSTVKTPTVTRITTKVAYSDCFKRGSVQFEDYPIIANSKLRNILINNFDCESLLEPYSYKEAADIDDIRTYQFDESVSDCDIEEQRLINIAHEKMEKFITNRMFDGVNEKGSYLGGEDKFDKIVHGQIIYVPVYYVEKKIESVGVLYLLANGETGDTYMNILDTIGGYGPISNVAKIGTCIACSLALVGIGNVLHVVLSFLPLIATIVLFAVLGLLCGIVAGDRLADLVLNRQINKLKKKCIHEKDIEYLNSGSFYVVPGSIRIQ